MWMKLARYLEGAGFVQTSGGANSAEYNRPSKSGHGELVVSLLTDKSGAWDICLEDGRAFASLESGFGLNNLKAALRRHVER